MGGVYSFRVNDRGLDEAIKDFRTKGGNLSGLICYLLNNYFFGDNQRERAITQELKLIHDCLNRIEEFEKWKAEYLPKIIELENKLKENQQIKQEEEEASIVTLLVETKFEDFLEDPLEKFRDMERSARRTGGRVEDHILARLRAFSMEQNIPLSKAKELFCKAFPEIADKVNL